MNTNADKVNEFHNAFDVAPFKGTYAQLLEFLTRRHALLQEEFLEGQTALMSALLNADNMTHKKYQELVRGYIDSLADVLYIAYGTLDLLELDADSIFETVHDSNMSKLGDNDKPLKNSAGKIMKGPNYYPPDLYDEVQSVMRLVTNLEEPF